MSHEYALSRVRDALEKSDNNHLKAQRLLLQWLEKDQTLFMGLAAPHMQAILSHAIMHVSSPQKVVSAKKIDPNIEAGEFGEALISSLRGGRAEGFGFGQATPKNISKPGAASQDHIDAINKLASAKKTDGKGKK